MSDDLKSGIYDVYSRRGKPLPDVYQYDQLPEALRIQIVYIWRDAFGGEDHISCQAIFRSIADTLARELGRFSLNQDDHLVSRQWGSERRTSWGTCVAFLMGATVEEALSLIEIVFRQLPAYARGRSDPLPLNPNAAILQLNERFQQHGVGYEFVNGNIVRIDSQFIHAAAVKPAFALLKAQGFKGAETESSQAYEHFRKEKYEDALTWACKSFESTMKSICEARNIAYDADKDSAKKMIDKMFTENVVPSYMQSELTSLRNVLESGLPTLRNKAGSHGHGARPRILPQHFAAYALHMAASNIVFLVECHNGIPKTDGRRLSKAITKA